MKLFLQSVSLIKLYKIYIFFLRISDVQIKTFFLRLFRFCSHFTLIFRYEGVILSKHTSMTNFVKNLILYRLSWNFIWKDFKANGLESFPELTFFIKKNQQKTGFLLIKKKTFTFFMERPSYFSTTRIFKRKSIEDFSGYSKNQCKFYNFYKEKTHKRTV